MMADVPQTTKSFKYWSNLHMWHGQELLVVQAPSILEADARFEAYSAEHPLTILDAKGEPKEYRGLLLVKTPWIGVESFSGPMFKAQIADNIQREPLKEEKGETSDDQKQ